MKNIRFATPLSKNWLNIKKSVIKLNLDSLALSQIEKDAFDTIQFEILTDLTIRSCIKYIFYGAFNGLNNLKNLTMIDMQLTGFPPKLLEPLQSLEWFSMQKCIQKEISIDNLFGTVNLHTVKKVEILNCNLGSTITEKTFSGLTNVNELILDGNGIYKIGPQSFDIVLKTLRNLSLTTNQLKSLPNYIFKNSIKSHIKISIQRNPWRCDCKLEYLRQFIQYKNNIDKDQIICRAPKIYAEKRLGLVSSLCSNSPSNASTVFASSAHIDTGTNHNKSTKNSTMNLNLIIHLPKQTTNGSAIHLLLSVQLIFLISFHLLMFFDEF